MITKVLLFNIALDALRLNQQVTDADTDPSLPAKRLRLMYPLALSKALADLDLQKTSFKVELEELALEHPHYSYVYKYPSNCAFFRGIVSPFPTDNRDTRIASQTEAMAGQDVIVTDQPQAWASIQPDNINLSILSPSAALSAGFQLAILCSSLIVGKGATALKKALYEEYRLHKAEAQENDANENVDTTPDEFKSEFIQARVGGRSCRSRT